MKEFRFFKIVRRQFWVYRKHLFSNLSSDILSPLIQLLAFGIGLGSYVGAIEGFDYLTFIVPGVVAISAISTASGNCTFGAYIRADYQKTYDMALSTPMKLGDIILAEVVSASFFAIISSGCVVLISFLFGVEPNVQIFIVPVIAFSGAFVFGCIALSYAGRVYNINNFNLYFELFVMPLAFISGGYFPITNLPLGLQYGVQVFPFYHVINTMRLAFFNSLTVGSIFITLAICAIWAFPFLYLARRSFAKRIIP
ncbi:MAG: ABC transporter [Promethearchaeota archaeon CR_4]|nr:MAG: ABC transporter [Candidatus Lokiarchaeota archaeon CR_4]